MQTSMNADQAARCLLGFLHVQSTETDLFDRLGVIACTDDISTGLAIQLLAKLVDACAHERRDVLSGKLSFCLPACEMVYVAVHVRVR
jgi:hypothetical protein